MKNFALYCIIGFTVLLLSSPVQAKDSDQCQRFCAAAAACKDPGFKQTQCLDVCGGIEENLQPAVAKRFLACQMQDMCSPAENTNWLEIAAQDATPQAQLLKMLEIFCSKMNACVPDDSRLKPTRCVELFTEQQLGVFLSAKGISLVSQCLKTCDCKSIDACFNRLFEGRHKPAPATKTPKPPKKLPSK